MVGQLGRFQVVGGGDGQKKVGGKDNRNGVNTTMESGERVSRYVSGEDTNTLLYTSLQLSKLYRETIVLEGIICITEYCLY